MTMIYAGNDMLQKKMGFYKMVMALTCVSSVMLMFIGTPLSMSAAILLFLTARQICSNRYNIYAAGSSGEEYGGDFEEIRTREAGADKGRV